MTRYVCVNGHDRCFGGVSAGPECPYCERRSPRRSRVVNKEYIVITARVVGGNGRPFVIEHYAGNPFPTKKQAVREGFEMYQSDDFFIGVLHNNILHHCEDIRGTKYLHTDDTESIAEQIGYGRESL